MDLGQNGFIESIRQATGRRVGRKLEGHPYHRFDVFLCGILYALQILQRRGYRPCDELAILDIQFLHGEDQVPVREMEPAGHVAHEMLRDELRAPLCDDSPPEILVRVVDDGQREYGLGRFSLSFLPILSLLRTSPSCHSHLREVQDEPSAVSVMRAIPVLAPRTLTFTVLVVIVIGLTAISGLYMLGS